MIFYLILIVLLILCFSEYVNHNDNYHSKFNRYIYLIAAIMLGGIAAIRYEVGLDWDTYSIIFSNSRLPFYWNAFEHGYILLNRFFLSLTDNYYILQCAVNCFYAYTVYKFFYKESSHPVFILLTYYLLFYSFSIDMTVTRMQIAIAILVIGKRFIDEKKLLPWVIFVVLASQFHITALIAIPLYWTTGRRISKKTALILLLVSFIINIFGLVFTYGVINNIASLSFLPNRFAVLIGRYTSGDIAVRRAELGSGLGLIASYIFYLLICLNSNKNNDNSKDGNPYILNFLLAIILLAFGRNLDMLRRLVHYYMIAGGGILSYTTLIRSDYRLSNRLSFNENSSKMLRVIVPIAFIAYQILAFYKGWGEFYKEHFLPYQVFFFK